MKVKKECVSCSIADTPGIIIRSGCALFILLAGCSGAEQQPTIGKEKMIAILLEARLVEGAYATRYERIDSVTGSLNAMYDSAFRRLEIDRPTFESAYKWYASRPELLADVESAVLDSLNARIALERSHITDVYKPVDSTLVQKK